MNDDYRKLVEEITNKVIESLKSSEVKKTDWESVKKIDSNLGGTLKAFSSILGLENMDILIGEFKKGEGLKKHYHKAPTEEIYHVLNGEIEVTTENKVIIIKKGEMLSIPPNIFHRPINHRDEVCKILFILSPREEGDPVVIE